MTSQTPAITPLYPFPFMLLKIGGGKKGESIDYGEFLISLSHPSLASLQLVVCCCFWLLLFALDICFNGKKIVSGKKMVSEKKLKTPS